MRIVKVTLLSGLAVVLSACTSMNGDQYYERGVDHGTSRPVAVSNQYQADQMDEYYPVPPVSQNTSQPSPTPPGSLLGQQEQQRMMQQQASTPASRIQAAEARIVEHRPSMQHSSNGDAMMLDMNYSQAWSKVGQALKSANYRIVDRDSGMGTYYVIDVQNGKVKRNAPIQQVHLKSAGRATSISTSPMIKNRISNYLGN